MYDLLVIGAGPAGISMAVEACATGVPHEKILLLELAPEHSFSIKKYYPDNKLVTANYKGFEAVCTGVMCLTDSSKHETISYLDEAIASHKFEVRYGETVYKIEKDPVDQRFFVTTGTGSYETRVVVVAIGILGKPNKPAYRLPVTLKNRLLFDVTSVAVQNARVLIVGGGDSASEYCQYLVQLGNKVTLSYRRTEFSRMNKINQESLIALIDRGEVEFLGGSNIASVKDVGGLPHAVFAEALVGEREFDFILYALGGTTPKNFLKTIGIEFVGEEPVLLENHETSVPGLFLIGDLSAGNKGGSIIWAFNSANRAMEKIKSRYLSD
ncbi:MAG: NAD(P)-binding domain-containing protein [Bacteroidota bacterium]